MGKCYIEQQIFTYSGTIRVCRGLFLWDAYFSQVFRDLICFNPILNIFKLNYMFSNFVLRLISG